MHYKQVHTPLSLILKLFKKTQNHLSIFIKKAILHLLLIHSTHRLKIEWGQYLVHMTFLRHF